MQERREPSLEDTGFSLGKEIKVPAQEQGASLTPAEAMVEKLEQDIPEQVEAIEASENGQAWKDLFTDLSAKGKEKFPGVGNIAMGGMLASMHGNFAVEAFSQNRKPEAVMWSVFALLGGGVMQRGFNKIHRAREGREEQGEA